MSEEIKVQTKTKLNKKLLIGVVAVVAIALIAALTIFLPKSAEAKRLAEQLDLGDKYLNELQYEQAVAAYLAAIEIDPKNADAYLGLADAYIAQGEYDKAIEVLEDAREKLGGDAAETVRKKLEEAYAAKLAAEVTPTPEPTATSTPTPIPEPTATNTPTPEPTATSTPTPIPEPTATSTPTPVPATSNVEVSGIEYTKVQLEEATVGTVVEFGSYEQDNNLSNGTEPVEWLVLDVQDGKALLLSLYNLDCQPYNTEYEEVTWETCTLRNWLNNEFYYKAFNETQRKRIEETWISNPDNRSEGGNDTLDNVFLLSIEEAYRYFPEDVNYDNEYRVTESTAYAIEQGAWNSTEVWYGGNCGYWLHSPGSLDQGYVVYVSYYGHVYDDGIRVQYDSLAVRPALWINLTP